MSESGISRPTEIVQPHSQQHALTFRVMRLTTPLPSRTNAPALIGFDGASATDTEPGNVRLPPPPPWQAEGSLCGVGYLSILPSSFGSIYASESFRSFISVFNRSADNVHNVSISIQVQTSSSRRFSLLDTRNVDTKSTLKPRASINNVVSVSLSELGIHVLVCSATYHTTSNSSSTPRTLRQFFRFNVLSPVDTSVPAFPLYQHIQTTNAPTFATQTTRIGGTSHMASHFLVHVRVQNALPVTMYAMNAVFSAKTPFHVRPLYAGDNAFYKHGNAQNLDRHRATMGSGDSCNFIFLLFCYLVDPRRFQNQLSIKENGETKQRLLGNVKVSWRSANGEQGEVEREVNGPPNKTASELVSVSIYAVPHQVEVHRPFVARCSARNNSNQAVRMYLQIRRDLVSEIVPVGVSGVSLGEIKASETAYCAITLIGLMRGQHNICGVRVVDMDTNVSYKAEAPMITVN